MIDGVVGSHGTNLQLSLQVEKATVWLALVSNVSQAGSLTQAVALDTLRVAEATTKLKLSGRPLDENESHQGNTMEVGQSDDENNTFTMTYLEASQRLKT